MLGWWTMSNFKTRSKILFIFTGSIAVYKAVTILSRLVQQGHDVECVLTKSALKFIGLSTVEGLTGKKAHVDLYDSENIMSHIHLIRDADLVLVAPGTANFINKLASGLADDLASTLFLAHDFKKPFIIAPAMNSKMFEHPITIKSFSQLRNMGVTILETGSGILACGELGFGKLLEPEVILKELAPYLNDNANPITTQIPTRLEKIQFLPKILITGGGTIEPIDDVRSLTNSSSGETAIQMARHFCDLGLPVTLVINNVKNLPIPSEINVINFLTFKDLNTVLKETLSTKHFDYVIHAAAVSDFSLLKIEGAIKSKAIVRKISSDKNIKLVLKPNIKIISKLASYSRNKNLIIVGFKLTSHADSKSATTAVHKLFKNKRVNYVIQNDVTEIDRKKGIHKFSLFQKNMLNSELLNSRDQLLAHLSKLILLPVSEGGGK